MSKEKDTEKDTFTLEELAELLHTTPEEIERRSKEAIEIGKRKEKERNAIQKKIEKEIVIDKKKNQRKKGKKQIRKEIIKELKTEGIKASPTTHSLVYRVVKPSEENPKYTEDLFLLGEELLQSYVTERKRLDKLLKKLLKDNEKQMNELFELVGATDEQKEKYLEALESDTELSEDLYFDIFGKSIEEDSIRIKGTPDKITKELLEARTKAKQEDIDEVVQMVKDRNLNDGQTKHFFEETIKFLNISDNPTFTIKEKVIDFGNVKPKEIVSLLDEQMELNKRAIEGMQIASKINLELMDLSNRFSVFVKTDDESIFTEEDERQLQLYVGISEEIQNSMKTYNSFTQLAKKKNPSGMFAKSYLEEKEKENETLKKLKEEILKQEEEMQEEGKDSEELFEYIPIATKNKLITQEKVIPQLFVQGNKIKEKISFDLVGDNNENWIVSCIMEQYPIAFTTHTFKTLESLMTIQTTFEKEYNSSMRRPFSTKDIIFLNKGGKVSKYTKEEIIKTNREITSIMSAVGQFDITEFMEKYNETRPPEKKIPKSVIKRISRIQNFAYMTGIEIEYNEDGENQSNTLWYFVKNNPIPIFDFIKITNRYTMLPLEMDSYLVDTDLNLEITRVIKSNVASVRYYKTKKKKSPSPFLYHYFEGIEEGKTKKDIYNPKKARMLLKEKKIVGEWRYIIIKTIDSIAKDCNFDNKRPIGEDKNLTGKEKTRFIDSIIEYLRKAKEDKNILDFNLYTDKDKIIKEENYITEGQQRKIRNKKKRTGTFKEGQRKVTKRNPSIYKIGIIIE